MSEEKDQLFKQMGRQEQSDASLVSELSLEIEKSKRQNEKFTPTKDKPFADMLSKHGKRTNYDAIAF